MASQLLPASAEVIILGGGVLVGRALELLLRGADCRVRFLDEASLGKLGLGEPGHEELGLEEPGLLDEADPLEGVRLLILAPGASAKCRKAVLGHIGRRTAEPRIKTLELVTNYREARVGARRFLPWPCRTEYLQRRVTAMLLDGSEAAQEDRNLQTPQKERRRVGSKSLD